MSIGTPFIAGATVAGAGSATLVCPISTTVPQGDCVAVWVTTNTSTNNISTVTDSQNNTYTPVNPVSGTNLNGQWFVADNITSLVASVDTITLTCTGTGGTKTVQAIGCGGVALANSIDQAPAGTSGASTSPSQTIPAGNQNNELALMGELNNSPGGSITYTGSFATPVVSNQQHTSAQFANVAAIVTTTAGSLTASGTIASGNWAVSGITLLPLLSTSGLTGLVGSTTPIEAYTKSGCYDFPSPGTQVGADNQFIAAVHRSSAGGHLTKTKKFWNEGAYEQTGPRGNDLANYISFGTKVMFALFPPHLNYTAADQTALATFLTFIKRLGFNASNCEIVLWQEPEIGNKFGNPNQAFPLGTAGFQAGMAFFGPTVVASGLPLVLDVGLGGGEATNAAYINAGLAAAGCTYTAIYCDYYFGAFSGGIRLATAAGIADAHNLPIGLGEFGCHVTDNYANYFNYITGFFQARIAAGKRNADLAWYQGQCDLTGAGDLTAPILSNTDPRVSFYQAMFDTLTTPATPNTITVTSPGNKSNLVNDVINLQIVATDSDPSQTLTFSAVGLPNGLSISPSGLITGTVTTQQVTSVTITATDGTGATGTAGFTWTVNPIVVNTVTVTNPGNQSTQLGAQVSLQLSATDSNVGITTFLWGAAGLPTGLTINTATGLITGTPTQIGSFSVSVTATDNTGSSGNANFTWVITNPNVLPAGKFVTLPPVNPSAIGGLGPAEELSYELAFGLTAGASSTNPFCAVTISFYDFDELAALQTPVDIVTFRCPMGTHGDPNGAAIIYGKGPQRGAFMRIQMHNVDTVDATLTFLQVTGTARTVGAHDWRWDSGGNSPVIPGFTKATAASASLVLGGLGGPVPANGSVAALCSMFAGKVYVRCHANTGNAGPMGIQIAPQPPSLFSNQSLLNESVAAGTEFIAEIALPRGPCLLTLTNGAGSSIGGDAEIIAIAVE